MTDSVSGEAVPEDRPDATDDEPTTDDEEVSDDHLDDLADGSGCTEIWEHLSERRDEDD